MKHSYTLILVVLILISLGPSWAQNGSTIGLSFKRSFIDYKSPNAGTFGDFKSFNSGFEIAVGAELDDNWRVYIPARTGVIKLIDDVDLNNRTFAELDAQLQYRFTKPNQVVIPYLLAGAGAVSENFDDINFQVPVGGGVDIKFFKNSYFNFQPEYRISFTDDRNNVQFSVGFTYLLGGSDQEVVAAEEGEEAAAVIDSDGDGIEDDRDVCPQQPGLVAFAGCPDSDGDGVEDSKDECPELAGPQYLNGCPDSDGDGVSDKHDECPNLAGLAGNRGCPGDDSDDDGVPDGDDRCPTQAGPVELEGCPDSDGDGVADIDDECPDIAGSFDGCPDTDGDGVNDARDVCPEHIGPVDNKGCPELLESEKELLNIAMRDVQFEHSSASLRSTSFAILNQIADLMLKYPGYKLVIGGHTDNTGGETVNQLLSERRAKACFDYLRNRGVPIDRVRYIGYGESRPLASNSTARGRAINRRVEFNLTLE